MGRWDKNRLTTRGSAGDGIPRCRRCSRASVLSPCRDCATEAEAKAYPARPPRGPTYEPDGGEKPCRCGTRSTWLHACGEPTCETHYCHQELCRRTGTAYD